MYSTQLREQTNILTKSSSNSVPGFTTSYKSRPLIISKLEEFIRNKALKLNSKRVINELNTFVWHNGKPQAMRGYNDDLIMSLAIACWIKDTVFQTSYRETEYKKAMLGGILKSNTILNTSIHGMNKFNNTDFSLKQQAAIYNQFSWIFKG